MRIQGKKVWIAGQFMAAQLEIAAGKILEITPYSEEKADIDYGDTRFCPVLLTFTPTGPTALTPTTVTQMGFACG